MSLDKQIKDHIKNIDIPKPLSIFSIFDISVFIWKKPEFHIELVETWPYELDGQTPLIFAQFAFIEIAFFSERLYKFLYRRKHGFNPMGLE